MTEILVGFVAFCVGYALGKKAQRDLYDAPKLEMWQRAYGELLEHYHEAHTKPQEYRRWH